MGEQQKLRTSIIKCSEASGVQKYDFGLLKKTTFGVRTKCNITSPGAIRLKGIFRYHNFFLQIFCFLTHPH